MYYDNDKHLGYMMGFEDALNNVAAVICGKCGEGGCPFKKDCEAYSDKECLERIINCFSDEFNKMVILSDWR